MSTIILIMLFVFVSFASILITLAWLNLIFGDRK
jgi:hypothetical protein